MSLGTDSRIGKMKIYKQEGSDSLSFPSVILADMTVWHDSSRPISSYETDTQHHRRTVSNW